MTTFNHGNTVLLYCMGEYPGARWLRANSATSKVDLTSSGGSEWVLENPGDGTFALRLNGSQFYLDGLTQSGEVSLAPSTGSHYTGTHWRPHNDTNDTLRLECLGDVAGPNWLDGRTIPGTVGLAPHVDSPFTGTLWKVESAAPAQKKGSIYLPMKKHVNVNDGVPISGYVAPYPSDIQSAIPLQARVASATLYQIGTLAHAYRLSHIDHAGNYRLYLPVKPNEPTIAFNALYAAGVWGAEADFWGKAPSTWPPSATLKLEWVV